MTVRKTAHESRLVASIQDSPFSCVITDPRLPDNPICAVNVAFELLTGYSARDVVGRNCRLLAGPGTDPAASRKLSRAVAEHRPELVELLNYRRDGSTFMNAVMIAPSFDDSGQLVHFVGSQMALPEARPDDGARRRAMASVQLETLSSRQRQVLSLLSRGLRNKQIASELGINEKTVKMHRAAMLERLGVRTSMDAIRLAVEAGI